MRDSISIKEREELKKSQQKEHQTCFYSNEEIIESEADKIMKITKTN